MGRQHHQRKLGACSHRISAKNGSGKQRTRRGSTRSSERRTRSTRGHKQQQTRPRTGQRGLGGNGSPEGWSNRDGPHGNPLGYIRDTYSMIHSGDWESIDSISLAIACQSIINSQGIQPGFGGDKGSGKTSSVKATLHLVDPNWIIEGWSIKPYSIS